MKKLVNSLLVAGLLFGTFVPQINGAQAAVKSVVVKSDYANHWAKAEIDWAVKNKVMWKYPDGTFRPNAAITQVQFVTSLVAFFHLNASAPVPELKEYAYKGFYERAKKAGILEGVEINPDKPLTRDDVALLLINAWKPYYNYKIEPKGYTPGQKVVVNRLMEPYPDNKFHGGDFATRGHIAALLKRLDNILVAFQKGEQIAQQFHNSLKVSNGYVSGKVPSVDRSKYRVGVCLYFKDGSYKYFYPPSSFKAKADSIKLMTFTLDDFQVARTVAAYDYRKFPSLQREKVVW